MRKITLKIWTTLLIVLVVGVIMVGTMTEAGAVSWAKFRDSIANLVVGNLTVKEDFDIETGVTFENNGILNQDGAIDADGGGDLAGGFAFGGGTSISKLYLATQDVTSSVTAITVTGVLPGDKVWVTKNNAVAQTINGAVPTTNTVTVTLSADPASTCTLSVMAIR